MREIFTAEDQRLVEGFVDRIGEELVERIGPASSGLGHDHRMIAYAFLIANEFQPAFPSASRGTLAALVFLRIRAMADSLGEDLRLLNKGGLA